MSVQKNKKQSRGLQLIAGGTLWADCPIGTINAYGGTTAPEGWLLCQGQALSRTDYADLFSVIGTNFGSGDGSTTFNIPDLRGEFLRGAGTNQHTDQGSGGTVGQHQDATEFPNFYAKNAAPQFGYVASDGIGTFEQISNEDSALKTGNTKYSVLTTGELTDTTADDRYSSRPTNTSVNYIIKSKQTPIPADLAAELETTLDGKNLLTFS